MISCLNVLRCDNEPFICLYVVWSTNLDSFYNPKDVLGCIGVFISLASSKLKACFKPHKVLFSLYLRNVYLYPFGVVINYDQTIPFATQRLISRWTK